MTRRIVSFVLVAALVVVALAGCGKNNVNVDGSYTGHSAQDVAGSVGQIALTIAGDKITEAKYTELMPKTKDNYFYATAVGAIATIQAKLIETGDITKVDAVAKATGTSGQLTELQVKTKDNYQYQTALDAWATLEQSLVTSQDVTKVDAVAKATGTSTLFKEAATAALEFAKNK